MRHLNLKLKVLLLSFFLVALSVGIGIFSLRITQHLKFDYDTLLGTTQAKVVFIDGFAAKVNAIRYHLRNIVLPNMPQHEVEESFKGVLELIAAFEEDSKLYQNYPFSEGQKELFENQQKAWLAFKEVGGRVLELSKNNTPENYEKVIKIFHTDCKNAAAIFQNSNSLLGDFHKKELASGIQEAQTEAEFSNYLMIAVILLGSLIGIVLSYLFAHSTYKALFNISESIVQVSGDTRNGSHQLASASSQLSSATTEAAASLEETVASLEELSSMVKQNSASAQEANALSQKSQQSAQNGEIEINKLLSAMSEISTGSKKIEEIIKVIDDIAFQTNLLALNAAVEAARAGEQGKGFAVVAEAVRSLAQRSAVAAKDISSLIEENVSKSQNGSLIAESSASALRDILTSIRKVADLNSEISAGSNEQANGLDQISRAMNQLDQATQGNASSAEEIDAFSNQLASHSENLNNLTQKLKVVLNGE